MVNPFKRGSDSFDQDDDSQSSSTPRKLSPKKSRKSSLSKRKDDKNPFANRGLDKFAALLAEMEHKKEKIYANIPSDEVSLVGFTCSDTNKIKPIIVVKARDAKQEKVIKIDKKEKSVEKPRMELPSKEEIEINTKEMDFSSEEDEIDNCELSFYYRLAAIFILIFVLLVIYSRSRVILCMCIGWFLAPIFKKECTRSERKKKKKEDARRKASDKKVTLRELLSSPSNVIARASVVDMAQV